MVKSATTITLDKVPAALAALRYLDTSRILIGVPASTAGRQEDADGNAAPINNAAIGFIQENGAPEVNIPARPFLVPGVASIKDQAAKRLASAAKSVLSADPKQAEDQFNAVGLMGQNAVRRKITDGPFIPLSERTLAARAARGVTRTKPLIDTGQLRAAITYVIRKIKGGG